MKNRKALILLLSANAISHFAQGISMLAIPWYFAKVLGASSTFATIYSVATFLTLFWGLYAGTLIDRFARKSIFLVVCLISALVLLSVSSIGYINGSIPLFFVALVFCFTIFNYNIHYPTLYAFGQEITEKKNYGKTNSLLEIIGQSVNVLSGAMAVLLIEGVSLSIWDTDIHIESWTIHKIFLLDGITYLIAMTLIFFIKYEPIVRNKVSKESIVVRLKEGVSYLKNRPLLFHFGNASYTVFIFTLIAMHLLWPVYIQNHLSASGDTYAITKIHYALGALFSGFFISRLFKKINIVGSIIILMLIAFICFLVMAIAQSDVLLYVFTFGIGVTNAGIRIQRVTYLFNHTPNHIIGRVNSVFQSINILLRSLFIALFSLSFFSEDSNITWAFYIACLAVALSLFPLMIYHKRLKHLEEDHST